MINKPLPVEFSWQGDIERGSLGLQWADGRQERYESLAALASAMRQDFDPAGLIVPVAAAMGTALQAVLAARRGLPVAQAVEEAEALLSAPTTGPTLQRMRACLAGHADLLSGLPLAARLLLEARRIQRQAGEQLALTARAAGLALPPGPLLLAWPAGPASDLGMGSLSAAVLARPAQQGQVWIAGPAALAADACAVLAAQGIAARSLDAAAAAALVQQRQVRAVLLRALGEPPHAEPSAVAVAEAARSRALPLFGLACPRPPPASSIPLPPALAAAIAWHRQPSP